jgi:hypothetical protein
MIKSVKVTPLYEEWENLGFKQVTGFGVYVACGAKDVDEILNLIKKMANRRYSIESGEEKDDD